MDIEKELEELRLLIIQNHIDKAILAKCLKKLERIKKELI